jgi:methylthioribose-1-phosphate isomerase
MLSVQWVGDENGYLRLLDQTGLPTATVSLDCRDVPTVWEAIKTLRVRGAPAIGIAAAYGVLLAGDTNSSLEVQRHAYRAAAEYLATSRPTAVNLFWALDRMMQVLMRSFDSRNDLALALFLEAVAVHDQDRQMCRSIGQHGAALIPHEATIITHCNAGGLATSEYGTALSIMFYCAEHGKQLNVFVDETRPLWQGVRLTAWELQAAGIPTTVICDSMAAHVMQTRRVDAVIVGADRITARGDVANKIGTYGLAVVAKHHGVPFYVAAPSSTFDLSLIDGRDIPIELRDADEVIRPYGIELAPEGVQVYNPAFDVTPAELVTAIITENGIIQPVNESSIRANVECI